MVQSRIIGALGINNDFSHRGLEQIGRLTLSPRGGSLDSSANTMEAGGGLQLFELPLFI